MEIKELLLEEKRLQKKLSEVKDKIKKCSITTSGFNVGDYYTHAEYDGTDEIGRVLEVNETSIKVIEFVVGLNYFRIQTLEDHRIEFIRINNSQEVINNFNSEAENTIREFEEGMLIMQERLNLLKTNI